MTGLSVRRNLDFNQPEVVLLGEHFEQFVAMSMLRIAQKIFVTFIKVKLNYFGICQLNESSDFPCIEAKFDSVSHRKRQRRNGFEFHEDSLFYQIYFR